MTAARGPLEEEPSGGPDRARKVRSRAAVPTGSDEPLTAVVEVTEPGYLPNGLDVRAAITPTMFTARIRPSELGDLDRDPRVRSVELGGPDATAR